MTEFWQHGYEATSIAALTHAMGITPPSLYAAFGTSASCSPRLSSGMRKRMASTDPGRWPSRPPARPSSECFARRPPSTREPSHPPGCLVINGAVNIADADEDVKAELRGYREATKKKIANKIRADVRGGRLPKTTDAAGLATFYSAVIQGMSTQACDGASHRELTRVVDNAMNAWPTEPA